MAGKGDEGFRCRKESRESLTVDLLLVDGFDVVVVVAIAVGGCD